MKKRVWVLLAGMLVIACQAGCGAASGDAGKLMGLSQIEVYSGDGRLVNRISDEDVLGRFCEVEGAIFATSDERLEGAGPSEEEELSENVVLSEEEELSENAVLSEEEELSENAVLSEEEELSENEGFSEELKEQEKLREQAAALQPLYTIISYKTPVAAFNGGNPEKEMEITVYEGSDIIKEQIVPGLVKGAAVPEEYLAFYGTADEEEKEFLLSLAP